MTKHCLTVSASINLRLILHWLLKPVSAKNDMKKKKNKNLSKKNIMLQVTAVRRETRLEKKKLAMAMRQKQLGALGMSVRIHHYPQCIYHRSVCTCHY